MQISLIKITMPTEKDYEEWNIEYVFSFYFVFDMSAAWAFRWTGRVNDHCTWFFFILAYSSLYRIVDPFLREITYLYLILICLSDNLRILNTNLLIKCEQDNKSSHKLYSLISSLRNIICVIKDDGSTTIGIVIASLFWRANTNSMYLC